MKMLFGKSAIVPAAVLLVLSFWMIPGSAQEGEPLSAMDIMPGLPVGSGSEEADVEICPQGAHVINTFLAAWQKGDYRTMYDLIDDDSKKGYPYEEAKFDLMMLEFKRYKISSVRKDGENFMFIISYGDWKDGDKDTLKAIVSGKTFKIIMSGRRSPFKRSVENYF